MKIMTITGIAIQVDVMHNGDEKEAIAACFAINEAIGGLNGQPQILGIGDIDINCIEVLNDEEADPENDEFECEVCGGIFDIDDSIKRGYIYVCEKCNAEDEQND